MWYQKYGKRILDVLFSSLLLVVLFPIMLLVAVLVRIHLGSPVIFEQERPGKDETIFRLYKFRSMNQKVGTDGVLLPDEKRLTGFGKALRASSLDELPELMNILKGEMSFVGPRPLLAEYLPLYNEEQKKRHLVRPGLTGLAQVRGRNRLTWEKRFQYDIWYVSHVTFAVDFWIVIETIRTVFSRKGITSENSSTMERFSPQTAKNEK